MRISAINTYNVKSSQNNLYNSKNKNNNIKNNAPSFSGHGANPIITNERGDVSCYILGEDMAPYFRDYNVNIKKDSVDKISQYLANNVQMYTEKFDKNRTFEKTENKYNTNFYIADPNEKITDKIRDEYGYIVYDNEPPFPTIEQLKDKYTSRKAVPHDYFADLTNYITYQQRVISADENSLEYPDDDYTAEQGDMYSSRINKAQQKIIYAQSLFNMMYKTGQEFMYKDELVNRLADLKAKYNSADFKLENIAFEKYLNELIVTEEAFEKATGKPMDHIYREPKGEYSLRSLSIIKDLGYKTYFWSAAYQDWDDKLTKEDALEAMLERVHNGAIYLLHPTSKGNYLALDDFIKTMKKEGYTFDLVKNID